MDAGLRTFQVYQLTQIDVLILINFLVLQEGDLFWLSVL